MNISVWLILDPHADRPYVSTSPPMNFVKRPGVRVLRYELPVPEPVPVDGVHRARLTGDGVDDGDMEVTRA